MKPRTDSPVRFAAMGLALLCAATSADAQDREWPTYRADAARSGVTSEELKFPLVPAWTYRCAQAPRPAWPVPRKESHRIDFDYGPVPVVAGGRVVFGSSADDTVRALDEKTGTLKWQFTAGAPVRFAPAIHDGKAYVASDDGVLYCLEASSGKLIWKFHGGGKADLILGNGRLVSRWPLRSGVLVDGGVAYFTAGMWPSEGVFVYALNAGTGEVIWCNDTHASSFIAQPHGGAYAITGAAPQGYALASKDILLVPTGRAVPAAFDRHTGRFLYYHHATNKARGGSWCAIDGKAGIFMSGTPSTSRYDLATGKTAYSRPSFVPRNHVRAGGILVRGGDNLVSAAAGKDEVWRHPVQGKVYGLAVANGQLIVGTDAGWVYCFRPAGAVAKAVNHRPLLSPRAAAEARATLGGILDSLITSKITKGYALVLGQPDARLAEALAAKTPLHVISVLQDAAKSDAERKRLLAETSLYGTRVAIVNAGKGAPLPLPPYFANLVVLSSDGGFSPKEVYGALRPCGGLICFTGIDRPAAVAWAREAGAPANEVRSGGESVTLVRGKLPGAYDWDSKETSDQRVSWPLELLWFGGPGPSRMADRHWGPPTPIPANGRYFVTGEHHVIAVDAYNGAELWSRPIPHAYSRPRQNLNGMSADDDFVYLNFGDACYQLDARTGEQVKVFGRFKESKRYALDAPRRFSIDVDKNHSASLTLRTTDTALEVDLVTRDPKVTPDDAWELYFDFRPAGQRYRLYETGAFQIIVAPGTGKWERGAGPDHPEVLATREPSKDGSRVVLRIGWDEIEKLLGRKPEDFGFAATLVSHDGAPRTTAQRTHQFGDDLAVIRNNGWATFSIRSSPDGGTRAVPTGVRPLSELPRIARGWARRPARSEEGAGRFPADRIHPLLGESTPRKYTRAYGCARTISSATAEFFRSGTIGFYDYRDDSGVRNFGGIRSSCGPGSLIPALGLLISNEGSSGCRCSYNFQTSLALVPTGRRRNEDWAVFQDTRIRMGALMRHAALNLGAPGDRRDAEGVLWQGFPRPRGEIRGKQLALAAPLHVRTLSGFGPYRVNADRTPIEGTDRPWIYASGYRGIEKATWDVAFYDPAAHSMASEIGQPPTIDGSLEDACWDGSLKIPLANGRTSATLRYDEENLYVGYRQEAVVDRRGRVTPIKSSTRGEDASVWDDDSIEVRISEGESKILHFGTAASGARYEGRWWPALSIPRIEKVQIDGETGDWGDAGLKIAVSAGGRCRVGWNERGLLYLARLDRAFTVNRTHTGLLFMMINPDSKEFVQLGIRPKHEAQVVSSRLAEGKTAIPPKVSDASEAGTYVVEALLPWENLGIAPERGLQISLSFLAYADEIDSTFKAVRSDPRARLFRDPTSMVKVRLADDAASPARLSYSWAGQGVVRGSITSVVAEDEGWDGSWKSAARLESNSFSAEMAIPWKTLEAEGMDRSRLKVTVGEKGKIDGDLRRVWRSFASSARPLALEPSKAVPGMYTVRLHFADLDNDQPGRRVFDVKLQGKVVLKDFDIVAAGGGKNRAVVREFRGIRAVKTIVAELVPKGENLTERSVPVLSGVEILAEGTDQER